MQTLNSAIARSNAVSVAKGFSTAVVSHPAAAPTLSQSFAQVSIQAAQSGSTTTVVKSVTSFAVSIVFLVVNDQQELAQTCVQSFSSAIVSAGGCNEFVLLIIQTFISITVTVFAKQVITFG